RRDRQGSRCCPDGRNVASTASQNWIRTRGKIGLSVATVFPTCFHRIHDLRRNQAFEPTRVATVSRRRRLVDGSYDGWRRLGRRWFRRRRGRRWIWRLWRRFIGGRRRERQLVTSWRHLRKDYVWKQN